MRYALSFENIKNLKRFVRQECEPIVNFDLKEMSPKDK